MNPVKTFEDLIIWQKSIALTKQIYVITRKFPKEETYGLSNQLRRASVSVASNIAEGYGRITRNDYKRFLSFSFGSSFEIQTQLIIGMEIGLINNEDFNESMMLSKEISAMLYAIMKKL
jgi:four helix bundle protein